MARELARLKLKIEGDTKGLRSSLKSAETQSKRTGERMRRAFRRAGASVQRLTRRLFSMRSALIALAGAAALGLAIKRAIDFADNIAKTARAVGLTTDSLQILRFAARRSGVDIGQLDKALIKMIKTVAELKTRISSELDLALKDFNPTLVANVRAARDQEEVLQLVAAALRDAATAADAAAIATGFFGRSGPLLVQIFRSGAFSAGEFEAAARRLGLVIDKEVFPAVEAAADELGDLGDVFKILATRAALEALPAMRQLAQTFTSPEFLAAVKNVSGEIANLIDFIARHQRVIKATFGGLFALGIAARMGIPPLLRFGAAALTGAVAFAALGDEAERVSEAIGKVQERLQFLRTARAAGREDIFGLPIPEEIAKQEAALARLQARLVEIGEERTRQQAAAPVPFATTESIEQSIKLKVAMEDLAFQAAALRGQFDELAEGTPALARQLGVFGRVLGRDKILLEDLSPELRELNDAMQELADLRAAAQVIEQTATAEEKLAFQTRELNRLKPTLIALLGSEARAQKVIARALKETDVSARKAADAAQELGLTFSSAFEDAVIQGKELSDVLLALEQDILRILLRKAVTEPLTNILTDVFEGIRESIFGSARGNVIAGGRIVPFQRGGVIDRPVAFPLRGGIGTAAETGAEAILPLRRLPSGDLGVGAVGGGAVNITIINNTGGEAQVRQSAGAQGGVDIEIILDRAVSRVIRGGGLATAAIQDTFVTAVRPVGR